MLLVWILSLVAFAHGFDSTKLWNVPGPMDRFYMHGYLGNWYIQYRNAPCSWSGSAEFTDYQTSLVMQNDKTILVRETSRNDLCNTINSKLYRTSTPGVLTIKDPMGNNWSGKYIIVYTDYKTCSITYGCTKMAATGNKCDDGWISIKTRMVNPGPSVIAKINKVLHKHWGTTVDQLQKVTHKHSCLAPPAGYGKGFNHHGYGGNGFGGPPPPHHDDKDIVVVQQAPAPAQGPAPAHQGYHGYHSNGHFGKKYSNY